MKREFYSTRKALLFLFTILPLLFFFDASSQQVARSMTYNSNNIPFWVYRPVGYNPNGQYPLIIFLHGYGERGPDNGDSLYKVKGLGIPNYIENGEKMAFTVDNKTDTFLVLSPQLFWWLGSWEPYYVDAMLQWAHDSLAVDFNRVYLTGLSLGGGGTWRYVCTSSANPPKFAAIAPVCGTPEYSSTGLCDLVQANTPVWAFHGIDDNVVPVSATNNAFDLIAQCNPPSTYDSIRTIYPPGPGHFIWDFAYDRTHNRQNPNLFEWFLSHSRASSNPCDTNSAPIAVAGNDATITTTTHTLSAWGSYDPGGGAISYQWSKISGPSVTMTGDIYATAQLSNLQVGTYVFKLRVTDNCGDSTLDSTQLIVQQLNCDNNNPPVAEAGNDLTINVNHYTLSSWNTYDPDGGSITSYHWTYVRGPGTEPTISGPMYATAEVSGLQNGVYTFKLVVTDECEAPGEDSIHVTVNLGQRVRNNNITQSNTDPTLLRIYPNPAYDRLYLSFSSIPKNRIKVSITDLAGHIVSISELQPQLISKGLDLAKLKQGVYIIQVESDGKKYTQRIVKK